MVMTRLFHGSSSSTLRISSVGRVVSIVRWRCGWMVVNGDIRQVADGDLELVCLDADASPLSDPMRRHRQWKMTLNEGGHQCGKPA